MNGKEIKIRNICLEDNCEFKNFLLNETDIHFVSSNGDVSLLCKNDSIDDQGWRIELKKYPKLTNGGNIRKATQISKNGKQNKVLWRGYILY